MSIKRMVAVWDHSEQSGSGLLLLLAIADYADENGLAWPGMTRLAEKARLDRSNVWRTINNLCASGELLALNRRQQRSNMYVVTVGLERVQLDAAIARARELGATSTRGAQDLHVPLQVLSVIGDITAQPPQIDGSCTTQPDSCTTQPEVVSPRNQGSVTAQPDPSLSVIDPSVTRQWGLILEELKLTVPKQTYEEYYRGSKIIAADNGAWTVEVQSERAAEWLDKRLRPMVEHRMERHAPGVRVEFVARGAA